MLGTFGGENTTFGDADFGWFGILVGGAANLGGAAGLVVIALIGAVLLGLAILFQRRVVDAGWDPSPHRESVRATPETEASGAGTPTTRTYAKIPPPQGAPAPPPPP